MRPRSTSGNARGKLATPFLRCYAIIALFLMALVAIACFVLLSWGAALPSPDKRSGRYTKLLRFNDDLGKYDSELLRLGARVEFVQVVFRHGARTPLSDRYVGPVAAAPGVTTSASTLATDVDTHDQTALRGLASGAPSSFDPSTGDSTTATQASAADSQAKRSTTAVSATRPTTSGTYPAVQAASAAAQGASSSADTVSATSKRLGAAAATWLRTDACEYSVKGPKMLIESQPGAPALTRDDVRAMLRALRAEGPVGRKAVLGAGQKSGVSAVAEGAAGGPQKQPQQQQATQNCSCGQLTRYGYSQAVSLGQWLLHRYGSGEGGSSSSSGGSSSGGSGGSLQGHGSGHRLRGPLALWAAEDDAARRLSGVAARSTHVARALLTLQGVLEGLSGAADTARHAVVPVSVAPQGYQLLYANTDLCPRLALLARLADRAVQVTSDAAGGADEARVRAALSLPPLVPDQASSWLSWKRLLDAAMCEEAARADGRRVAAAEAAEAAQVDAAAAAAAAQAEMEAGAEAADIGLQGQLGEVQDRDRGGQRAGKTEVMNEEGGGGRTGKGAQVGVPARRVKRSSAFRRPAGPHGQLLAHSSGVPSAAAGAARGGEALVEGMAHGAAGGGLEGGGRRMLLAGEMHVASGGAVRHGGSGNSSGSDGAVGGVGGGVWNLWGGRRWQPVAAPLAGGLDDDLYAIVDEQATRRVAAVLGPACNGTGTCQQLLQLGAGLMLQEMLVGLYGAAATASNRGTAPSTGATPGSDADAAALLDDATREHRQGDAGGASGAEGAGGTGGNGSSSASSDDGQEQGKGPLRGAAALAAAVGPRQPPVLELLSGHDSTLMPIMAALGHPLSRWPAFAAHLVIELHRVPVGRGLVATSTAGGSSAHQQGDGQRDGDSSPAAEEQGRVGDEGAQAQAGQHQAAAVADVAEGDWEGEEVDVQAEPGRHAEEGEAAGGEDGEGGRMMEGSVVEDGASGSPSWSVKGLRRLLRWGEVHGSLREWGGRWSWEGRRQSRGHGPGQRQLRQLGIEAEVAQDDGSWGGKNNHDGQTDEYEFRVRLIYNGGSAYRVLSIDTPSEGRTWLPRLDSLAAVLQPYNITRPAYEQLCGRVDDLAAMLQGELGAAATATAHGHFFDKDPLLPATAVAAVRAAGAAAKASLAAGLPKGSTSGLRRG